MASCYDGHMVLSLLLPLAQALTIDEAVKRAGELDPDVVIAGIEAERRRWAAWESAGALGPSVELHVLETFRADAVTSASQLRVSTSVLDPAAWLDAAQEGARARAARVVAEATRFDAEYAAAALYYECWSAERGREAQQGGVELASRAADLLRARTAGGVADALDEKSAALALAAAEAALAEGEERAQVARWALARAVRTEPDALVAPPSPAATPELVDGPWIEAQEAELAVARRGWEERVAAWLPAGTLSASSGFLPGGATAPLSAWTVSLGAAWRFDPLLGPYTRTREARLLVEIEETRLDALRFDQALARAEADARVRSAERRAEVAARKAELAVAAEALGEARYRAGLLDTLELLRLQAAVTEAREELAAAELARDLARLERRRAAGVPWAPPPG